MPVLFMRLIAVIGLACCQPAGAAAGSETDLLRMQVEDILAENDAPSAVIAVADGERLLWQGSFGWADIERRRLAGPDVSYSIASVSKSITATAVMILVERGLVDPDAPIGDYLRTTKIESRAGDAKQATVRRVLDHTAGFPHYYDSFVPSDAGGLPETGDPDVPVAVMLSPGETYQYSNLGYMLLERMIENVTGMSYAAFLHKEVFEPLGMADSFVPPGHAGQRTVAARYGAGNEALPFYDTHHRAASAIYASANDLVRFGRFHLHPEETAGGVLTAGAVKSMRTFNGRIGNGGSRSGLGFEIRNLNGHHVARHTGGMPGVNAELLISPDDDLVVVVLLNRDVPAREAIMDEVLRVFAPHLRRPDDRHKLADAMAGQWTGAIIMNDTTRVPVSMALGGKEPLAGRIGETALSVRHVREVNGFHEIDLASGGLPLSYPHTLRLKISLRDDRLDGFVTAYKRPGSGAIGRATSYWMELERTNGEREPAGE